MYTFRTLLICVLFAMTIIRMIQFIASKTYFLWLVYTGRL